jgi:hypothetical protein
MGGRQRPDTGYVRFALPLLKMLGVSNNLTPRKCLMYEMQVRSPSRSDNLLVVATAHVHHVDNPIGTYFHGRMRRWVADDSWQELDFNTPRFQVQMFDLWALVPSCQFPVDSRL